MQALAFKAYGEVKQRTAGERNIEFELFQQITEALEHVARSEDVGPAVWADAIHRNLQLWSTLAVDLLHPGNALPAEVKRSLLYLSEFVRQSSMKILSGEGELSDLIEINRTIMGGMLGGGTLQAAGEGI